MSIGSENAFIVFSGYNQRAVIAFLRTLRKLNIPFGVVAKSPEDAIFLTDYKSNVLAIREKRQLDLDDILNSINKVKSSLDSKNYLIAPSTEALNRFLLDNIESLKKQGITVPLVSTNLYETISDKLKFTQLCQANRILTPMEYSDFNDAKEHIPFVAKPLQYYNSAGIAEPPFLILTSDDLTQFEEKHHPEDFYYQEYLEGDSYYLLYYFYQNGKAVKFSQKNIAQQPEGKSIVAAVPSRLHLTPIAEQYEELFRNLHYRGFVMVELRKQNEKYYMIEANPRFWGPSQLFVDANVNLFLSFLEDYNIIQTQSVSDNPDYSIRYYWFGGIQGTCISGGKIVKYENIDIETDQSWLDSDIYRRNDTIDLFKSELMPNERDKQELIELYERTSKHAHYQIMPKVLSSLIRSDDITVKTRYEKERLDYILDNIQVAGKTVLDIGGNTGFFSFEMLDHGSSHVDYVEGNADHCKFVQKAVDYLQWNDKFTVRNQYYTFNAHTGERYDIALLLNVLHHIGDDYGNDVLNIQEARKSILEQLNSMADISELLVFQLGFNWKGNRNIGLFQNGAKKEMIDFITQGIQSNWDVVSIAVPEKSESEIVYRELNDKNIIREDSLGEFLNRPLFILKSKKGTSK